MSARLICISTVLVFLASASACGKDEDPAKYSAKQSTEVDKKHGVAKTIRHAPPVTNRRKIACAHLLDNEALNTELGEKVTVHDINSKYETAKCAIRREGETPDEKTQEKIKKEKGFLGVLPGDVLCQYEINCWLPAQDEGKTKALCKQRKEDSNRELGLLACVQIEQKGAADGYIYRFVDPDTKCAMKVKGGPSVLTKEQVQKCAMAAIKLVTADGIKK